MWSLFSHVFRQKVPPPAPGLPETNAIVEYLRDGLPSIEGWGLDFELARTFLDFSDEQERQGVSGSLFEIGVHHGRTAILLALMARPDEVSVFLDLFDRQSENIDRSGCGDLEIFKANLTRWAPGREVEIHSNNSISFDFDASVGLRRGVRFAHIDGGHYTEVVLNDLYKTERVLCPGGLIVIDDFLHPGFPGVNEACNRYLQRAEQKRLAPIALGKGKLILASRSYAPVYVELLKATLRAPRGKITHFYGDACVCLDAF